MTRFLIFGFCFATSALGESNLTNTIHRLVRADEGGNTVLRNVAVQGTENTKEVTDWLLRNGPSLQGTKPGPFEPTEQYVSRFRGNKIYVHVLDWSGKNNISLPAVIDRPITRSYLLQGPAVRVDQAPWGLLIVVPEEQRPDHIDTIIVLEFATDVAELAQPRIVETEPSRFILLQGDSAKLRDGLRHNPGPDWIEGWTNKSSSVTWRVRILAAGDYTLAMTYSCAPRIVGAQIEITSRDSKVVAPLTETKGMFGSSQNFERRELGGNLHLHKGVNSISMRVIGDSRSDESLRVYGLYLYSPKAKVELTRAAERARKHRASTNWLQQAKYGLMVHWAASTAPRSGPSPNFCDAVKSFDVTRFADMVQTTGARYLIFTLAHGIQKFPTPLKAVDAVLSDRTCNRDLPGELADALEKRDIKLILYYHHGVGDPAWAKASGFLQKDKSSFFANEKAILQEIGLRYGTKLAGWWFDDRFPLQPFEELFHATKVGNSSRLVAWNSWIMPKSTEFQDYWAGELGGELVRLPENGYFEDSGPQNGLQPHVLIFIDDPWMHAYADREIQPPRFSDAELADYIKDCNRKNAPVTLNIGVYLDGAASPATVHQLAKVRKLIYGK